jgi:hypothetical protein
MLDPYVKPLSSGSVLPWLTADRIVTTNSLSQLATPSSISSPQSLTLSGTATATVAGLITAQSGLSVSSNAAVSGTATITGLLTASSALTVASTATLQGVTTVVDGNFSILGSSDPTKTIKFEVDAQTTADDLTINSGAQTDDRTATFPVLTGNSILTLSNATLTTGRIPYATTNGILTDSTELQFASRTIGLRRTPHSWGANYCGVEQQGSALAEYYDVGNIQSNWLGNTYDDGAGAFKYSENGTATGFRMFPLSKLFRWQTAASGVTGGAVTFATAMELTDTGLVISPTSGTTLTVSSTTDSTTKDTGSIVTEGGIGVEKAANIGTSLTVGSGFTLNGSTQATIAPGLKITSSPAAFTGDGPEFTFAGSRGTMACYNRTGAAYRGYDFNALDFQFLISGGVKLAINAAGSTVLNSAAVATTATDGFLYVAACAGPPTGVPTAVTGRIPIVVDSTNNKLYFYSGGAWRDAGP